MPVSSSPVEWPLWSAVEEPRALGRYVLPDVVSQHVAVPEASPAPAAGRLRDVWQVLRAQGIGYAHSRLGSVPGGQWVRPPGEVLSTPRNGTCLDVALVLAGACVKAGLPALVVALDAVESQRAGHALVAVRIDGTSWPDGGPGRQGWSTPPADFVDTVRPGTVGPPRKPVLVLDPNGLTHAPAGSTALGTDADLDAAAAAGLRYLTAGAFRWRVAVAAERRPDVFVPAPTPRVRPLRENYREPDTAESALRLLRAEFRVTTFQPRDELTVLLDFCERTMAGDRTGVAVVHAVGGAGKTRLVLELAETLRARGWYAGPLRERTTSTDAASTPWLAQVRAPLMVFVDYADARVEETTQLLQVLADRPGPPATVVLTARTVDGDWLPTVLGAATTDGHPYVLGEAVQLPDAHPDGEDLHVRAYRALGGDSSPPPVPAPTGRGWTTLDLLLFGWLAATSTGELPTTPGQLYTEVLEHEKRYWLQTYRDRTGHRRGHADVLARAAAVLTLRTPPAAGAGAALAVLPELATDSRWRQDVAETLTVCLQAGAGQTVALRPDPIGDHHLLATLTADPALLRQAVAGLSDDERLGCLVVLNRAGQAGDQRAVDLLAQYVRAGTPDTAGGSAAWLDVASVAAHLRGPAEAALVSLLAEEIDDALLPLDDLCDALPFSSMGAWQLALHAEEERLRRARGAGASGERLAALLLRVSQRRHPVGDWSGALAAIDEAVTLRRELATTNPTASTPDLATALNDQAAARSHVGDRTGALKAIDEAVTLRRGLTATASASASALAMALHSQATLRSQVGDRAGALTAIDEAVSEYRELVATDSVAFTLDLAMALNTQATTRSEVGDRAGAVAAIDEAVALCREPVAGNPATSIPDLAMALTTQANLRSGVGDRTGALTAIDESVKHHRELVATNPAAFTPDLAKSLNNQAIFRSQVGDRTGALTAVDEAISHYRGLVASNAAAFTPDLASALASQANRRIQVGDRAGALAAIDEAVTHYRDLVATDPTAFTPDLANSLNNQATQRSQVGDRAGALTAIDEAVTHYRDLVATDPTAFTPFLAGALTNQAIQRSQVGDRAGALTAVDEAVTHYRELVANNPNAFTPDLARGLGIQSLHRDQVGDRAGSLAAVDEAVTHYRELVANNPNAFTPDLANSLNKQATQRSQVGDRTGARTAIDEAVTHYRELVANNPNAFTPDLAGALTTQANLRSEVGDRVGALTAVDEAVDLHRELFASNATAFTPDLARSLTNQAVLRDNVGNRTGALTAVDEAVTHFRDLVATNPTAFTPDLAAALTNQAVLRGQVGDDTGALTAIDEAVTYYCELVATNPNAFTPDLANSLNNQAIRRSQVGDRAGALTAIDEAVTHYRELVATNPTTFTPHLANSLRHQADQRSHAGDRSGALESIGEAVTYNQRLVASDAATFIPALAWATKLHADLVAATGPHAAHETWTSTLSCLREPWARAEVRAGFASWLLDRDEVVSAHDQLAVAATEATTDSGQTPPYLLTRARLAVRNAAGRISPVPDDLPVWLTAVLPASHLDLVDAWRTAGGARERERLVHDQRDILTGPAWPAVLETFDVVHPGRWDVAELLAISAAIADRGWAAVVAHLHASAARDELIHGWFSTRTWSDRFAYLAAHREGLSDPAVLDHLQADQDAVFRQHAAILELTAELSDETVVALVTDAATAGEHARAAVRTGHFARLQQLLQANPAIIELPGRGPFLFGVLHLGSGLEASAVLLARQAAAESTDVQRKARLIDLRHLADALTARSGEDALDLEPLLAPFRDGVEPPSEAS